METGAFLQMDAWHLFSIQQWRWLCQKASLTEIVVQDFEKNTIKLIE